MPKDQAAQEPPTAEEKAALSTERVAESAKETVDADAAAEVADKTDMSAVGDDGQVFGG